MVIDVDTISHVQKTLIDTVTEVAGIQDRAQRDRDTAVEKIMGLRQELNERLIAPSSEATTDAEDDKAIH